MDGWISIYSKIIILVEKSDCFDLVSHGNFLAKLS